VIFAGKYYHSASAFAFVNAFYKRYRCPMDIHIVFWCNEVKQIRFIPAARAVKEESKKLKVAIRTGVRLKETSIENCLII